MNILITGSHGFIARNLIPALSEHKVYATTRETLDPLLIDSVKRFFDAHHVDIVIHTAIKGGRRLYHDDYSVFYQNLLMFENLITFGHFNLFINFGSGAEFDRRYQINEKREKEVLECVPIDFYGLSKNIIARTIYDTPGLLNLRLFNVFGPDESEKRFITTILSGKPMNVLDKYMDFFYIEDLCKVVQWCISNSINFRDINCVYPSKYKLIEIAEMSREITGNRDPINVIGTELSYTGNGDLLSTLPIKFIGLKEGMNKTFISRK